VSNDKFYEEISEAIVSLDKEKTIELANKAIQENVLERGSVK